LRFKPIFGRFSKDRTIRFESGRTEADGHYLTYLHRVIFLDDLNLQPIPNGKPIRLMHFDDEPPSIIAYAWTRDGKKIAVTRALQ